MSGREIRAMLDRARRDPRLSDRAFRLLHALVRRLDDAGWVRRWPVEAMATELSCSSRTVGTALTQLSELGYVWRRLLGNGCTAAYRVRVEAETGVCSSSPREPQNPALPSAEKKDSSAPISTYKRELEEKDLPEGDLSPPLVRSLDGEADLVAEMEDEGQHPQAGAVESRDFERLLEQGFFDTAGNWVREIVGTTPGATSDRVALTFLCVTRIHGASLLDAAFREEFERALTENDIGDLDIRRDLGSTIQRMRACAESPTAAMERHCGELLASCLLRVVGRGTDHEQAA